MGRWAWTCWTWRWSCGARGEAFALATVVRCERPTSAKPGAKALIRGDGAVTGWVGGACAEPVVVREALKALRDGQPRLVALVGEGGAEARRAEGLVPYPMTCHSGGTLEIYVEPFVPKPLLVLVGHGPVLETLAALGRATDFDVMPLAIDAAHEDLGRLSLGPSASVVVGTHGSGDEEALEQILRGGAGHVSLIASRKRAAAITRTLAERGVAADRIRRLHAPAGLDIGATTPAEIAVSILAEVIQHRRARRRGPAVLPGACAECHARGDGPRVRDAGRGRIGSISFGDAAGHHLLLLSRLQGSLRPRAVIASRHPVQALRPRGCSVSRPARARLLNLLVRPGVRQ